MPILVVHVHVCNTPTSEQVEIISHVQQTFQLQFGNWGKYLVSTGDNLLVSCIRKGVNYCSLIYFMSCQTSLGCKFSPT